MTRKSELFSFVLVGIISSQELRAQPHAAASLSFDVFAAPREAEALKRYRDASVTRAIWMLPSKGREEVLPMLDQCAALMRQL